MKDLIINPHTTIPGEQLRIVHARSSGPGGQNVNKVNSKVTLNWKIVGNKTLLPDWTRRVMIRHANRINSEGEFQVSSQEYRQQHRNLAACCNKLRALLIECQFPKKTRRATRPTLASKKRRLDSKRKRSEKKSSRRQNWSD